MIAPRTIISGSTRPIFAVFSLNESVLSAGDLSGPLFQYPKGRCHGNQFSGKMANSPPFLLWHSEREWDIATSMSH